MMSSWKNLLWNGTNNRHLFCCVRNFASGCHGHKQMKDYHMKRWVGRNRTEWTSSLCLFFVWREKLWLHFKIVKRKKKWWSRDHEALATAPAWPRIWNKQLAFMIPQDMPVVCGTFHPSCNTSAQQIFKGMVWHFGMFAYWHHSYK